MPLSKEREEGPVNVPFALLGQVSVADMIVTPDPTSLLARVIAVAPGVIVICPRDSCGKKQPKDRKNISRVDLFISYVYRASLPIPGRLYEDSEFCAYLIVFDCDFSGNNSWPDCCYGDCMAIHTPDGMRVGGRLCSPILLSSASIMACILSTFCVSSRN